MEITELINHPEQRNRETLYELRSLLALHPYYQTARLLKKSIPSCRPAQENAK